MTLSREVRRLVLPGLVLSTCFAGQLAAAPGFAPMRPAFGIGPRPVVASRVPPGVRGGGDLRRARHEGEGGGRFAGGVGIAVLPVVPPIEPGIAAGPALQDYEPARRSDERWAWDEPPQRASCIRPLIIDLRPQLRTRPSGPRVIYGMAPPVCPRS